MLVAYIIDTDWIGQIPQVDNSRIYTGLLVWPIYCWLADPSLSSRLFDGVLGSTFHTYMRH